MEANIGYLLFKLENRSIVGFKLIDFQCQTTFRNYTGQIASLNFIILRTYNT